MAKLLVQETAGVREFELVDAEVRIGRELDNALRLSDPSISRHHAVIRRTVDGYEVEDLQSSNGVLVNGTKVQTLALQDGDRVTLGQVHMTFVNPQVAESPLGTVRMNLEDMAKIQAPVPPPPAEVTSEALTVAEPAPEAPAPPIPPAVPPVAPRPVPSPRPVAASVGPNPLPDFLQSFFPPVPDPARPTGERGDFVTRLLAVLIDWVFGFVITIPIMILMFIPFVNCIVGVLWMLMGPLMLVATAWCWIRFGATPGKKIMKLRVVPEDNPEGRIDVAMAVLRVVGHVINGMLFGLPYLMVLGAERKGLQDILSKSLVIKVDQ